MSWLFSRALVEEYSQASCSDGEPSAPLSVMPTQHRFWRNGKTMESSGLSRFGLTCAVLTEDHGTALLMSFQADFRAKTSASLAVAPVLMANARDCGLSSPVSLAKYDPASHTLKTAQLSLIEDLTGCYVTLPRSGAMCGGIVYQQPTSARPTIETGYGSLERFPTPTVHGNYNRKGASQTSGDGLATYVRKFPTPTAYKGWSKNHNRAETDDRLDYTVEREAHHAGQPGRLNPTWEEWLMAWPIGWTALKPLGMDRYQEWLRQHGESYQVEHE